MRRLCATCALSGRYEFTYCREVRVQRTEANKDSRKRRRHRRVSALLHDQVHEGDRRRAEERRQHAHTDVGDIVRNVAVANILELKAAVEPHEPARQSKEEFRKWRMHVEVVGPLQVVRGELAEVDLVEAGWEGDTSI